MAQPAAGAAHVDHARPGVQDREEDLAGALVGPVVGGQCDPRLHAERLRGGLLERDAGVVDEDVDAAVLLLHEIPQLGHGRLVTDVEDMELGLEPLLVELSHGGLAPALVPGGEVDVPLELLAQGSDDAEADPLVGARDHCYRHLVRSGCPHLC